LRGGNREGTALVDHFQQWGGVQTHFG
jgi:hypothetical protein